jgi:hypothetical protein
VQPQAAVPTSAQCVCQAEHADCQVADWLDPCAHGLVAQPGQLQLVLFNLLSWWHQPADLALWQQQHSDRHLVIACGKDCVCLLTQCSIYNAPPQLAGHQTSAAHSMQDNNLAALINGKAGNTPSGRVKLHLWLAARWAASFCWGWDVSHLVNQRHHYKQYPPSSAGGQLAVAVVVGWVPVTSVAAVDRPSVHTTT